MKPLKIFKAFKAFKPPRGDLNDIEVRFSGEDHYQRREAEDDRESEANAQGIGAGCEAGLATQPSLTFWCHAVERLSQFIHFLDLNYIQTHLKSFKTHLKIFKTHLKSYKL